ncbi:MAG: VacB/RNase II family 3'-5' exoribonuclease [Phycisphaeraceae bacterium]|nr:VacB/RNase II family 3'-5' exoribonuclease [Phycisphaeraceae bacterium]
MPSKYQRRLFSHLQHEDYTPRPVNELAEDLRVEDLEDFRRALKELADRQSIVIDPTGRVALPSLSDIAGGDRGELIGTFKSTGRGFAFIEPRDVVVREGSVFVPPGETGDALSGDIVRIAFTRDRRRERQGYEGKQWLGAVIEVVERKRTHFAGTIGRQGSLWVVYPDGKALTDPIVVRDAEAKNVTIGDKVIVDITAYPEGNALAEGVITKVLGEAGEPEVETAAVIAAYNLPGEFPDSCVEQAREAARKYEVEIEAYERDGTLPGRDDLTKGFIFTIDPPDAKDYDDAISIEPLERDDGRGKGGWRLGVHIADVAHFIPPGTALDEEAVKRGNSCYLPRLVIPMLPELLSNGICSLQEGVYRYAKTAYMEYDRDGNLLASGTAATLIRSAKRLTYLEAQALIDGDPEEAKKHARTEPNYTEDLLKRLRMADACAKAIRGRRQRQGMISLELPESVLIYDEQGKVVDAEREDDAFTHTLIEMFMVEANEVLARLFERMKVPLLRRVHPEPTPGDSDSLRKAAMVAGFRIPANPTRQELQSLLEATRGTPASRAVHMAVLRTLTKAEYSPALIGHFALASGAYAHFTSPIRRYADLTVHRSLAAYLSTTNNAANAPKSDAAFERLGEDLRRSPMCPDEGTLTEIGRHITGKEVNAEEAEQQLRKFLILQLLSTKLGEVYPGVVTGVNPKGCFVQIDKFLIDGFVKKEDLPGDVTRGGGAPTWKIDSRTGALVDARSGRSFNMGDSVQVRIAQVNLDRRELDLVIDNAEARAAGKAKGVAGLTLGSGGGLEPSGQRNWQDFDKPFRTGSQKRSQRSKSRDKGKKQHRRDKG